MFGRTLYCLCLSALIACGGSDDGASGIDKRVDSGSFNGQRDGGSYVDAGLTLNCSSVPNPFPVPSQFSGFLLEDTGPNSTSTINGGLDDDIFVLSARNGRGVFSSGLATGTFTIEGSEADLSSCGLCIEVRADVSSQTNKPTMIFAADSGEIEIQTISNQLGESFSGSVSALGLRQVDDDGSGIYTDVSGGCRLAVEDFSFTTTLQTPPSND